MNKQNLSARMILRSKALVALEKAILPGFCEDMKCDNTCPYWARTNPTDEMQRSCIWIKTYQAIGTLDHITERAIAEESKKREDNREPI